MPKRYDQAYFDRWYRDPQHRQWALPDISRKVRMVLGLAEYLLGRPVRSVLDVGCGEGSWQPILTRLRPRLHYAGVDDSDYVVRTFGRSRNIRKGRLAELSGMSLSRRAFDLVVCCDVLHYVPTPEVRRGLTAIADLALGPAYLEAYTTSDDVSGDHVDFQRRAPGVYRKLFRTAGFTPVGPHMHVGPAMRNALVALERAGR